jgi:hypothetical protein
MPKITYRDKMFTAAHRRMIKLVEDVVTDYTAQGYDLTLRQVYYQMVARDLFPDDRMWRWTGSKWVKDLENGTKNADPNYKWLGGIIDDARYAGLIDWAAITDRTRNVKGNAHWDNPSEIIEAVAAQYQIDKWADQENRVEVWVEKDALVGIVGRIAARYDVSYFSCRGYTSSSELWAAAMRLRNYIRGGQTPVVIHLGDHDPSGKDMTRDIFDRISLFAGQEIEVDRIALNMDQIQEYDPPPNPAKLTDSRARSYIEEFGDESWELDALEPRVISDLIEEAVLARRDADKFAAQLRQQNQARALLKAVSDNWDEVAAYVEENYEVEEVADEEEDEDEE